MDAEQGRPGARRLNWERETPGRRVQLLDLKDSIALLPKGRVASQGQLIAGTLKCQALIFQAVPEMWLFM